MRISATGSVSASRKTGITTMAILPNYAMFDVARERPRNLGELGDVSGVGTCRAEKWGEQILKLVR